MRIYVKHIPNTFNYGSLMMAVNAIYYLNRDIENAEFFVDCKTDEDLNRLKRETGLNNISIAPKYEENIANNILAKIIKRLKIIKEESKFYDLKIILGGDDISEYYGKDYWLIGFPIMFIENICLPTIMLGQTIGPFTSYRKLLAKFALNKAIIYTRDDKCFEYLCKLGVKTAKRGRDLAFLELPMQEKANSILNTYDLVPGTYVVMVPSGLVKCYTNRYEDYLNEQYRILKSLMYNPRLKDKIIVLMAHVRATGNADKIIIEELERRLTSDEKSRIISIKDDILASEARAILGNGIFTITGRMHAAISSFYMRKPAISLSYSVKYEGVIAKGLDMRELVIDAQDPKLWENGIISQLVTEKVEYVLDNYNELVEKIDKNVAMTTQMVIHELKEVLKDINNIKKRRSKQ